MLFAICGTSAKGGAGKSFSKRQERLKLNQPFSLPSVLYHSSGVIHTPKLKVFPPSKIEISQAFHVHADGAAGQWGETDCRSRQWGIM